MPRSLARLKFKASTPVAPLRLPKRVPHNPALLEQKIRNQVLQLSKPAHLDMAVLVNPRWKNQPGDKKVMRRHKPHTLRDLADPNGHAKHGEIIYVFRHIRTNQIIYSLNELLEDYHLEQLPFIGKHSKPPTIRPDEWTPHCVVTFPSPEQGQSAFRKLREFRRLHEVSWDKTNPEWKQLKTKPRIRRIMDQKANMSADLAEVLRIQEADGKERQAVIEENEKRAKEYLERKWPEIEALANAAQAAEREGDNVKWLRAQINNLAYQLKRAHNQNEADQKRLQAAKKSHESRLKKLEWAVRKSESFKEMQAKLNQEAELANKEGSLERLEKLRIETHSPKQKQELARLEKSFAAKTRLETRDDRVSRSILPPTLRNRPTAAWSLEGVEVKWADVYDAEFATDRWPESILHEQLALRKEREEVVYLRPEEYAETIEQEVPEIVAALQEQKRAEIEAKERAAAIARGEKVPDLPSAKGEAEKTGIWKFVPEIKNPFKRAEA